MSICQGITMGSIVTHDLVSGGFFKKEPDGQTGLDPVVVFTIELNLSFQHGYAIHTILFTVHNHLLTIHTTLFNIHNIGTHNRIH